MRFAVKPEVCHISLTRCLWPMTGRPDRMSLKPTMPSMVMLTASIFAESKTKAVLPSGTFLPDRPVTNSFYLSTAICR